MRKLLLGAAIAFASFSTQAQYAEAFLGDLKYGYRGTFTITSAYVPTPGTLALLAMGLVFGLRRRH